MLWHAEGIRAFITHGIRHLHSKELEKKNINYLFKSLFLWYTRASREECQKEIKGWANAVFKKFAVEKLAWDFVKAKCPNMKLSAGSSPTKRQLDDEASNSSTSSTVSLLERLKKIEDKLEEFHENMMLEINALKTEYLFSTPSTSKKTILLDVEDAPSQFYQTQKRSCSTDKTMNASKKVKIDDCATGDTLDTFKVDTNGYVEVYTDGACTNNGFHGAKAGIGVWFGDGHSMNISEPVKGRITNNSAEIEAATAAINAARSAGIKKLKLFTDSSFLIFAITNWIKKWEKNGWKTADGAPVKNKEELILLNNSRLNMDVLFVHVKGHAGNYENEQADSLARAGATKCPASKML